MKKTDCVGFDIIEHFLVEHFLVELMGCRIRKSIAVDAGSLFLFP
jgi:hypothetical protein